MMSPATHDELTVHAELTAPCGMSSPIMRLLMTSAGEPTMTARNPAASEDARWQNTLSCSSNGSWGALAARLSSWALSSISSSAASPGTGGCRRRPHLSSRCPPPCAPPCAIRHLHSQPSPQHCHASAAANQAAARPRPCAQTPVAPRPSPSAAAPTRRPSPAWKSPVPMRDCFIVS